MREVPRTFFSFFAQETTDPPLFGGSSSVGTFRIPLEKQRDPEGFSELRFARLLSSETFGQVAQSVEQRPEKPCVASSILALSTKVEDDAPPFLFRRLWDHVFPFSTKQRGEEFRFLQCNRKLAVSSFFTHHSFLLPATTSCVSSRVRSFLHFLRTLLAFLSFT